MGKYVVLLGLVLQLVDAASHSALALCVTGQPKHVYVGNVQRDASCNYNSIQSAIDNAVGNACGLVIDVTPEYSYFNQALVINNKNLTLQGWGSGATCKNVAACTTTACTVSSPSVGALTLQGENGQSVFHIEGTSNVAIDNFEITGGCVGSQCKGGIAGGGIEFSGNGNLILNEDVITANNGDYGAGVDVSATDGNATLTLNGTDIIDNVATYGGGGIHLVGSSEDKSTLIMEDHASEIWGNEALTGASYGGGINLVGNATAFVAGDAFGFPAIQGNTADYGGGIAATSNSDGSPLLYLYSISAGTPTSLSRNTATTQGGGLYVGENSTVALFDFQITGNMAPDGAAIYSAGSVSLNESIYAVPANAVNCSPSLSCNAISDNQTDNQTDSSSLGSVIAISSASQASLVGYRLIMRDNIANENLINASQNAVTLRSCLFADNTIGKHLIDVPLLSLANCTIANNTIGDPVIYTGPDGTFELVDSIIDQPGVTVWDRSTEVKSSNIHDDLATETSSILGSRVLLGTPTFANPSAGDFHLTSSSAGIDVAAKGGGSYFLSPSWPMDTADLDLKPRDVDLTQVPNVNGPRDLGAYEVQQTRIIIRPKP